MLLNVVIFGDYAVKMQYLAVNMLFVFCLKLLGMTPYCLDKFGVFSALRLCVSLSNA